MPEIFDGYVQVGAGLADISRKALDFHDTGRILDAVFSSGASRAVLTPAEWGPSYVDPTFASGNDYVAAQVAQRSDCVGLGRINPRFGSDAVAQTRHCLDDLGMIGVVMRPATDGYYLADSTLIDPVLDAVAERRKLVVFNLDFFHSPNCMPIHVLRIAENYPTIPILLGQIGMRTTSDATLVAQRVPNVYLLTAGMGSLQERSLLGQMGMDRIIYASDAPIAVPAYESWRIQQAETATPAILDRVMGGTLSDLIDGTRA